VHSALCSSRLFSPLTTFAGFSTSTLLFFFFVFLFVGGHTARIFQFSGQLSQFCSGAFAAFPISRNAPDGSLFVDRKSAGDCELSSELHS
jgi:hypothetical protein